MKKLILRTLAASALVLAAGLASAATVVITDDPAVVAKLDSGAYPMCQAGLPTDVYGNETWTCGVHPMGSITCCKTS